MLLVEVLAKIENSTFKIASSINPKALVALFCAIDSYGVYRGSYMSAHVLLNLLNELGKRDKMRGLPSI